MEKRQDDNALRFLYGETPQRLKRPLAKLQPVVAKRGTPNIDLAALSKAIAGVGVLNEPIYVESPEHWRSLILGLDSSVDAILPVSIPAYPTEIWNSHPEPIVERGIPVVFWPLVEHDEPDFWRWSARDFLRSLGVEVHLVKSCAAGLSLLKAFGVRRFLKGAKIVSFGEQNFPWNANAGAKTMKDSLGVDIVVRPLSSYRSKYPSFSDEALDSVWAARRGSRYVEGGVSKEWLRQALRTYLSIKAVLEEEKAFAFGVNCFGDLISAGERDVPCLAQALLREDGYIASCDGDYCAILSMAFTTLMLDKPSMMSNMYPLEYVGALKDHFGSPLSPSVSKHPKATWRNLARLAHCGFVGIVPPEMAKDGRNVLKDWGGTYEIKRDGSGCGLDGSLKGKRKCTCLELRFDGRTLLVADAELVETTRHKGMPHCESSALLKFKDLRGFVEEISREHVAVVYGSHVEEIKILAELLSLKPLVF